VTSDLKRRRPETVLSRAEAERAISGGQGVKRLAGAPNSRRTSRPGIVDLHDPAAPANPGQAPAANVEPPTDPVDDSSRHRQASLALFHEIARNECVWPSLSVFAAPSRRGRVTLVSESILPSRSTGRTEAGFALAALLARRLDHDLRFLCRQAGDSADAMQTLLDITDLDWDGDIDVRVDGERGFDLSRSDVLVTTSWQSTIAVARTFDPRQVVFLVEEDERLLGVSEGDMAGFAAALELPGLNCVVKSHSLGAYLAAQNLVTVHEACFFEPAFPPRLFYQRPRPAWPRVLTAFANPACLDDMHDVAIVALRAAICENVLPKDRLTICLFGADPALPAPRLPANIEPVQDTGPLALAELAGRTDIALCLNRKPYASYRPLEMMVGGAVIVGNISEELRADAVRISPDVGSIVRGIAEAVGLRSDRGRAIDPAPHRSWSDALGAAVERVVDRFDREI
jgi:hypothetical protein